MAKINALHTFVNANAYQLTAQLIDKHPNNKHHLLWPMIVNEAFALELFLKCLHEARRRSIWGHEPHDLFHKLSKADRKSIEIRYNAIIVGHPLYAIASAEGVPLDIESVLLRAQKLFTGGRYWHERIDLSKDSQGYATNAGVGSLSDAIRDLLYEIKPDWKTKIVNFKWTFPGKTQLTT